MTFLVISRIATIAKHKLVILFAFEAVTDCTRVVLILVCVLVVFCHCVKIFVFFHVLCFVVLLYQGCNLF